MIFSSYSFIFVFLPVTFAGYWCIAKFAGGVYSKVWLVAASLFFYAQGSLLFLPILVGTMLVNYLIVCLLGKTEPRSPAAKGLLLLALAENLGLLFYFKYYNFFLENVNRVLGTEFVLKSIILPLGISFYTFLILGYVIDVYKGRSKRSSLLDYAVFVTFFPHLIVGPVSRHDEFTTQMQTDGFGKLNGRNVILGILLFSIGCAKKIIIADPLISHAQHFYNVMGTGNFFESWGGVIAYTFAYYFDFSGYGDMAVGLGLLFNIRLPFNFDSPYKAVNYADFWRRWNITISLFFNEHIFKNIFHFGNKLRRLILATLATFLVSGIWHGAGWHFIFWGFANGVLVCIANVMTIKRKKIPAWLGWAGTFLFTLLTRVLFDSNSMSQALSVYKRMADIRLLFSDAGAFFAQCAAYIQANPWVFALVVIGAAICFFAPNTKQIAESFEPKWYHAAFAGALLSVSLFLMGQVSGFLYFQF
ncbi:hypothetical protein LJC34_07255 [Oscillospiraceae bacterium OttesenSCG-928-G22]|nr:hypothetical protein [Oscillospiraceae bacterium OttesenSCG-928-G22]